jgi:hypothetical protein
MQNFKVISANKKKVTQRHGPQNNYCSVVLVNLDYRKSDVSSFQNFLLFITAAHKYFGFATLSKVPL